MKWLSGPGISPIQSLAWGIGDCWDECKSFVRDNVGVLSVVGVGTACAAYAVKNRGLWWPSIEHRRQWLFSLMTDKLKTEANGGLRNAFNQELSVAVGTISDAHPHPNAAAARNAADSVIQQWITAHGMSVYELYGSNQSGEKGVREYHRAKDLTQHAKFTKIDSHSCLKIIDADYYMDDLAYWLSYGRPIIMYTFCPRKAAGTVREGHYWIDKQDRVHTLINGSCEYIHKIWDYNCDHLWIPTFLGRWYCSVDAFQMPNDDTRRIVAIIPTVWVPYPMSSSIAGMPLQRMKFVVNDVVCVKSQDKDGKLMVSVGRPDAHVSVEVPSTTYAAIQLRLKYAKNPLIGDVERILSSGNAKIMTPVEARDTAPLLYDILRTNDPGITTVQTVGNAPQRVRGRHVYHPLSNSGPFHEDQKETGRVVGPCLVKEGAVCPTRGLNSEKVGITERVEKPRNTVDPPAFYKRYADEFVQLIVPDRDAFTGVPFTIDEVVEHQNKPNQKQRSGQAAGFITDVRLSVRAFQKKEPVGAYAPPRNISTLPTQHILRLSAYTLELSRYLKQYAWYMPGKTPREIANRLRDLAQLTKVLLFTDFSKLDGSISRWLRIYVEQAIFMRYFGFNTDLGAMLRGELDMHAVTISGVAYNVGAGRASGSPTTSVGNTLLCAFIAYVALRQAGHSAESAFHLIGAVCGDDGAHALVDPKIFERVALDFGLTLKTEVVEHGGYSHFLGRVFLDLWSTDASIQDPIRTLGKLHLSMTSPEQCSPDVALMNKAYGYSITDGLSPIVGAWAHSVLAATKVEWPEDDRTQQILADDRIWWSNIPDHSECWPQEDGDLAFRVTADILDMPVGDVYTIHQSWANLVVEDGVCQFPEPRILLEREVKTRCMDNEGNILEPAESVASETPAGTMVFENSALGRHAESAPANHGNQPAPSAGERPSARRGRNAAKSR